MRKNIHPPTSSTTPNERSSDIAQAMLLMNPDVPLDQFPADERGEVERFRASMAEMDEMKRRYGGDCYSAYKVPPPAYFFELLAESVGDEDPEGTAQRVHRRILADWKMPEPVQ